ncbi:MAG: hypothetical protein GXP43_01880 [bacterium]|nr:hypothetical protein [bacterium]
MKKGKANTSQPVAQPTDNRGEAQPSDFLNSFVNPKQNPISPQASLDSLAYPFEASPEYKLRQQKLRYEQQQIQEKVIFDRRQQEIAKKIAEIRQELVKLAKEIGQEAKHIERTLLKNIPEPSDYQLSFLDKIKKILILLRKKISQSRTWLDEWQERSKKRRYYWYHFKKSGTKFWLSGERSIATQTG